LELGFEPLPLEQKLLKSTFQHGHITAAKQQHQFTKARRKTLCTSYIRLGLAFFLPIHDCSPLLQSSVVDSPAAAAMSS
jgi:hypothetical protein